MTSEPTIGEPGVAAPRTLRRWTYDLLESHPGTPLGRIVSALLVLLILANVASAVLSTVQDFAAAYGDHCVALEKASIVVFLLEYLLRLWCCVEDPRFARPVVGRTRFALQPLMVIDLLAVLPALAYIQGLDLRVLRSMRMVRVLRLLKIVRYTASVQLFGRILKSKAPELASTLFVMLLLLVVASSLMYYIERDANPAFSSIPTAMWWGIATFTTVGYGDLTPITPLGRILGGAVAILGIAMFAIPAGVLGAAFAEEMQERRRKRDQEAAAP